MWEDIWQTGGPEAKVGFLFLPFLVSFCFLLSSQTSTRVGKYLSWLSVFRAPLPPQGLDFWNICYHSFIHSFIEEMI